MSGYVLIVVERLTSAMHFLINYVLIAIALVSFVCRLAVCSITFLRSVLIEDLAARVNSREEGQPGS